MIQQDRAAFFIFFYFFIFFSSSVFGIYIMTGYMQRKRMQKHT